MARGGREEERTADGRCGIAEQSVSNSNVVRMNIDCLHIVVVEGGEGGGQ